MVSGSSNPPTWLHYVSVFFLSRLTLLSLLLCSQAFFIRSTSEKTSIFECPGDRRCNISVHTRTACKFCRFQKCLKAGMTRKGQVEGQREWLISPTSSNFLSFCIACLIIYFVGCFTPAHCSCMNHQSSAYLDSRQDKAKILPCLGACFCIVNRASDLSFIYRCVRPWCLNWLLCNPRLMHYGQSCPQC